MLVWFYVYTKCCFLNKAVASSIVMEALVHVIASDRDECFVVCRNT